jgi:hypothetical protein
MGQAKPSQAAAWEDCEDFHIDISLVEGMFSQSALGIGPRWTSYLITINAIDAQVCCE